MYNKKFFWGSVILGVMILLGAWFFQVFTDLEIASRLMAAILGVVITAIITQLLLQGQTDKEEHLRKNQQEWQEKQAKKGNQKGAWGNPPPEPLSQKLRKPLAQLVAR